MTATVMVHVMNYVKLNNMKSPMHELQDEHYLRAVTELGDTCKIVAGCDIYSQSGIKLIAPGIHITSYLYERLVKHKFLPSWICPCQSKT